MKIKRWTAVAAVVAAGALVLSGCSSSSSSPSTATSKADATAIIKVNGSEPQNPLIPTNTNEVGGGRITDNIFAGLVYYDAKGAPHNDVADSIKTTDSKTYDITLKSGQKFTDGTDVTASSFVDAWNYGALLSNKQLNSYFFESIEGFSYDKDSPLSGLKVVSPTEFTVTLNQPESDFPLRLGYTAFMPLPASALKDMKTFGEHPVGNGPYKLASSSAWKHNVDIKLAVNKDYTGPRKPANGGLDIVFYSDISAAYADLQSGNLDVLDEIPDTALKTYKTDLGDRAIDQPAAVFQSLTIPSDLKNFSHPAGFEHLQGAEGALRRAAISEAINRPQITKVIFSGSRTPAKDFTSPVIDGYSDSLTGNEVLTYNPDNAKKLWAQADAMSKWTGKFEIGYNSDGAGNKAWVDAVANSIKNVLGIDAEGAATPTFAAFRTTISPDDSGKRSIATSAFRSGWQADYPALYNFLGPLYGTGAGSNDGDYSNPKVDELFKQGLTQTDSAKANELFQQAQEILLKDLPAIPLWYSNVDGGYGTAVSNVKFGWNSVPIYTQITKSAK